MDKQMKRKEKTIQEYKEQLTNKGIKNISEFVELIIQSDITKGKYTRFLIDCFITDKFRLEDLKGGLESTIGQAISLFHKHKAKLPEEMRSVTKYSSPGDLWNAVREYEQVLTRKEEKRSEKEKAYTETKFVYHDIESGFQIVSPKTVYSAQWWGKGTRWCTSAENNNMFEEYAIQVPLFVIIMPDGNKLQLWNGENNIQFMDEADNDVKLDYIEANWRYLKDICLWINDLSFIPEKHRTFELCQLAIQKNGRYLKFIPKKLKTPELCQFSVKKDGWALIYVPEELITYELCKIAVQNNGYTLKCVPNKYRTYELCEMAVQKNGRALQDVPEELKTFELYQIAVKRNGIILRLVPEKMKTPEICQLAVEQDGGGLEYVPEPHKTYELCKIAVGQRGLNLQYVKKEFRTKEMCELAIPKNGNNLCDVPEEYKTPELCLLAVQQCGEVLQYVPEKLRTRKLCELAVQQDGRALDFVPEKLRTGKICKIAVKQNEIALEFVPKNIKSQIALPKREFIIPDYTEKYNEIRSLFPEQELSYKL